MRGFPRASPGWSRVVSVLQSTGRIGKVFLLRVPHLHANTPIIFIRSPQSRGYQNPLWTWAHACQQLQSSYVAFTSSVTPSPEQGRHPRQSTACIPKPHTHIRTPFLPTTRAALASPQPPPSFLHQFLSPSPCAPSPLRGIRPTTTPPRCCKSPTKRFAGTPPTLLARISRCGVIPATLPNS